MSEYRLRPPIEKRPHCPACHKPRRPLMRKIEAREDSAHGFRMRTLGYEWTGAYTGYDPFCTLRCALKFAEAAHRAGYRMKPKA